MASLTSLQMAVKPPFPQGMREAVNSSFEEQDILYTLPQCSVQGLEGLATAFHISSYWLTRIGIRT